MENMDPTVVWACIIGFAVFAYVVMDGFDLGIGILFPLLKIGPERDQAMNSIAPVWDGNETWLVLGGGGLMAMFPLAFSILLPATYPLMIAMLLGLVFRGVAFEFRWRDPRHRRFWDFAFTSGSLIAALCQGMTLGAILQGVSVEKNMYAGSWLDWLTPFSVLTGVSVVFGYSLLGATWLIWKTERETQQHARKMALSLSVATLVALVLVSVATPFLRIEYWQKWFVLPHMLFTAPVPILVALSSVVLFRGLKNHSDRIPFFMSLMLFFLGFVGLGVSVLPQAVPPSITIWDAAAPRESQIFLLRGAVFIIPTILTYSAWAYWVFRGKVSDEGYH
ncbi:cytochrome d ubiquinol oxidase subunit 2 (plasmid) [Phaeobacter piscinae]|uniref:Cytochrome d ubiquinol oxidase subunit 2 n=1 Tax=Phaeobacter piscinae TaxID=1580596 RepID=A0ABM6PJ82_9RHOB|nr:cytochrome d ubiquinol oxidase subunit II [Phaeobacter piscinae]ATG37866.1 cytochrome d ubiquinol oxidase subunit 2 [Phaeobacter piscinae]AUQ88387.1 cytochrome d ubiquinol oxidase subunit 2 [Phaeobacter piscinae]AUR26270.1 cytochrome d ubiquinol oxidase subunit 2 [Phaeobacter piscinae]